MRTPAFRASSALYYQNHKRKIKEVGQYVLGIPIMSTTHDLNSCLLQLRLSRTCSSSAVSLSDMLLFLLKCLSLRHVLPQLSFSDMFLFGCLSLRHVPPQVRLSQPFPSLTSPIILPYSSFLHLHSFLLTHLHSNQLSFIHFSLTHPSLIHSPHSHLSDSCSPHSPRTHASFIRGGESWCREW